ncbi:MAG: hypothetical protein QOJ39_1401 [Candidatus Eremiobacteraeota bacterium]|jgi:hypothetical protein|nr:hypothetical protein [Candidatus Eremiobacteraeota bacterium]
MWNAYVRRMMDLDHRLVLCWCAHLAFEDVLRIDHGSIHAAYSDPLRNIGDKRLVFGDGRLPRKVVPRRLVSMTQQHIAERAAVGHVAARHDEPVFVESHGERITRETLFDSIRRALALVRLSDAFLSGKADPR